MQEEKNTQEDSKHTGKFRVLSVVLVVAVALFVSSPISAFAEKFPTLPDVGTDTGGETGGGEDTGNSEENDTADLSKDSSQWVDRDKSGIYDGSINSMIDSDEEEADEPEQDSGMKWFVDVINAILTFIPIQIANALYSLLNMLGASLDNLIYGRLVSDVALFTFGLENGNVYGIIGSIIYNILRGISLLGCMTVFMANVSISSWKQGHVAWDKLKEEQTYGEAMAANQDTLDAEDKESIDRALKDTDDKLAKVRDRKKELDFENADKSQYPELAAEYSDLMQEENALLAKKERLQARSDQELLKEEPANLQKAISDADSEKEQLLSDRQVKVRERNQLQAQRDLMTGDSSEYQKLGESISAKDNEIRQIDTQIQDCESRSYSASKALRAQENELRDRQAYNLGERVKAQQEYDTAAAELERYKTASGSGAKSQKKAAEAIAKQQKIMENASSRMADLSVEDARINEKLQEFDPNRNQYSMSDLQRAKSAQQVRRAEAQSRIAVLNAEIGALDPSNTANKEAIEQKRQKIRQLTAITADAGLQTARLDQMISGLKENGGYSVSAGKASSPMGRMGAASSEYERKRQAIMERYATIDNFEEPQFNNISHERRAELLRGRALHSRLQSTAKIRGMMIGGSLGALTGMYMGPAGMVVGGMIGNATYTPFRNLSVNWRTNKGLREAGAATRSYADSPLDVKVYSDLNGKSVPEQMKVIDIVSRDFAKSLEKDGKLEQIFNDDLVNDAAMRESRKALLKKYNIKDAQGYESAVNRLRNEFSGTAKAIITEKETRMLERCAGEQYVNLSEKSKKRIMDKVIGSRDIALDNQLRTTLNVYLPKKWEDSFLR